jgi:hypothetical protein
LHIFSSTGLYLVLFFSLESNVQMTDFTALRIFPIYHHPFVDLFR